MRVTPYSEAGIKASYSAEVTPNFKMVKSFFTVIFNVWLSLPYLFNNSEVLNLPTPKFVIAIYGSEIPCPHKLSASAILKMSLLSMLSDS